MSVIVNESAAELNSLVKAGTTSRNQDSRSNPVCLEVPITIVNVPANGNGAVPGATPSREEGRTVIVFEHGAVLRLSSNIPAGQTLILSNPQGREAVCRVINARNLPSIKGYVEVEFVETIDDYWGIQSADVNPPSAPTSLGLEEAQQEFDKTLTAANAPAVPTTVKQRGSAPSFEDVEGLVGTPAKTAAPSKAVIPSIIERAPVATVDRPSSKVITAAPKRVDAVTKNAATAGSLNDLGALSAELAASLAEFATAPKVQETEAPAARPPAAAAASPIKSVSAAAGRGMTGGAVLGSATTGGTTSASETRSKTPLMIGGVAILAIGLAGGYFLFNRGGVQHASVANPSEHVAPAVSQVAPVAAVAPTTGSVATGTVPATSLTAKAASSAGSSAAQPTQTLDASSRSSASVPPAQSQRSMVHQPAHDLNMQAPAAANRNSTAKNGDLSASAIPEIAAPAMVMGMPGGSTAPAAPRPDAAPAMPTASSAPTAAKLMAEPKLVSTVRPVYPELAKQSNIQGAVLLSIEIDAAGNVVGTKVVSGPMFLRQAAIDAVKKWKYSPALNNGKPVAATVSVNVAFQLSK